MRIWRLSFGWPTFSIDFPDPIPKALDRPWAEARDAPQVSEGTERSAGRTHPNDRSCAGGADAGEEEELGQGGGIEVGKQGLPRRDCGGGGSPPEPAAEPQARTDAGEERGKDQGRRGLGGSAHTYTTEAVSRSGAEALLDCHPSSCTVTGFIP